MTTSTGQTEEVPWNFEHEPKKTTEGDTKPVDMAIALRFEVDGLKQKVHEIGLRTSEVARVVMRAVKGAMSTIGMRGDDRGPDPDAVIEESVREAGPVIRRSRQLPPSLNPARVSMWVAVGSALCSVVTVVFFAGRLTAKIETTEASEAKHEEDIRANNAANARQDVTLGIIGAQNAEIMRQLGIIQTKLDERVH